ncbi:hypothetical protein SAMN05421854_106323 [Amycolatopsis rubida]|uniref:Uncharacterized protein n=1 Tax=Amycolatopsis rubida TaxID=112413 RepID=A0A1I5SI51_9PSEU|nr:hypothetical protein SAMN05421854_106323 [Amycolatopsis rubida]
MHTIATGREECRSDGKGRSMAAPARSPVTESARRRPGLCDTASSPARRSARSPAMNNPGNHPKPLPDRAQGLCRSRLGQVGLVPGVSVLDRGEVSGSRFAGEENLNTGDLVDIPAAPRPHRCPVAGPAGGTPILDRCLPTVPAVAADWCPTGDSDRAADLDRGGRGSPGCQLRGRPHGAVRLTVRSRSGNPPSPRRTGARSRGSGRVRGAGRPQLPRGGPPP